MQQAMTKTFPSCLNFFGPAEVVEISEDGEHVRVVPRDVWEASDCWARLTVDAQSPPSVGDEVLVAGDLTESLYVMAYLNRGQRRPERLTTSSGVCAEVVRSGDGEEKLRVFSGRDELLFELDPATGATRLAIPSGRLELLNQGDMVLRSGGTLRLEGNSVELCGRKSIGIAIAQSIAAASSWLRLHPNRLQLGGDRIEMSARQGDLQFQTATVRGETLSAEADVCQVQATKMSLLAETLVERARNVYRTARDLFQIQAGRFRSYISGASHYRSQQAYFSAEESFHIDGDKIHLG